MSRKVEFERSFAAKRPDLLAEWDYEKNIELCPDRVGAGSHEKVWWRCKRRHSWLAVIQSRANGTNCPFCSGKRAAVGETDFATLHPELMVEWHYKRNQNINPQQHLEHSLKKVWWKCSRESCKQEWCATISGRTNGRGCPYCAKQRIIEGKTDFGTLHPDAAKEWAYDRNNNRVPEKMPAKTQEKVWWRCSKEECGQYWQASLANRSSGTGCPYCTGKRAILGKTDFATLHPALMREWNYEKNHGIEASSLREGSDRKVWWKCSCDECGYEWATTIRLRVKRRECPQCIEKRNKNASLAAIFPDIAKEWAYNLNNGLCPENVRPFSGRKVWWKCSNPDCQMNWQATVVKRAQGRKCHFCSGYRVTQGKNDLASCFPELLGEWDYELNSHILPNEVAKCSNKIYWWKCRKCGHTWEASVGNRTYKKSGCPCCAKKCPTRGNDLATVFPALLNEWDFDKNIIAPLDCTVGSYRSVWWKCSDDNCKHQWKAPINVRVNGCGCPRCSKRSKRKSFEVGINDIP